MEGELADSGHSGHLGALGSSPSHAWPRLPSSRRGTAGRVRRRSAPGGATARTPGGVSGKNIESEDAEVAFSEA
jgi:hypothetical protein